MMAKVTNEQVKGYFKKQGWKGESAKFPFWAYRKGNAKAVYNVESGWIQIKVFDKQGNCLSATSKHL